MTEVPRHPIKQYKVDDLFRHISVYNVRKSSKGDSESLISLGENMKREGQLHPVTLAIKPDESFEVIAGQRRVLAAKKVGIEFLDCQLRMVEDPVEKVKLSLSEGLFTKQLAPEDVAQAYQFLLDNEYTSTQIASELGISHDTIYNYLQYTNKVDPVIKEALDDRAVYKALDAQRTVDALNDAGMPQQAEQIKKHVKDIPGKVLKQMPSIIKMGGSVNINEMLKQKDMKNTTTVNWALPTTPYSWYVARCKKEGLGSPFGGFVQLMNMWKERGWICREDS
jgi:ParB/RepB/Spo0J family partition protein